MKTSNYLAIAFAAVLTFSSCSSEDSQLIENENQNLLKTYKVKRDAAGAYSVVLNVSENTKVDKVIGATSNISQFYLYSSDNQSAKSISQELLIDNNNLKVGFVDANANENQLVSILDDNISYLSKNTESNKLSSYSVQGNENGTFDLAFNVNDNVDVSFVYNEEISTYEVHLEDGNGGDNSFSRTLEAEEGAQLKIDFVNHNSNVSAKSSEITKQRKPRIVIGQGDD